ESVETTAEGPFKSLGRIRRQERGKGSFDNKGLGYALAHGVVGKLAGEIGWQPEGVLGAHCLEIDSVTGVHRHLAGQPASLGAQHAGTHSFVIRLILAKGNLRRRLYWLWCDVLVLGKLGLSSDSAIGRVLNRRTRHSRLALTGAGAWWCS